MNCPFCNKGEMQPKGKAFEMMIDRPIGVDVYWMQGWQCNSCKRAFFVETNRGR